MKAKITLSNIKGYLQGNTRKIFDEWFDMCELHIKEQAIWRLLQVKKKSPECFKTDSCVGCGCQVSSKVFEDRKCKTCYPEMMDGDTWIAFKHTKQYKDSTI